MYPELLNNFSIIAIIVIIALLFAFRALLLWYWRVNKIVEVLESILRELRKTNSNGKSSETEETINIVESSLQAKLRLEKNNKEKLTK